MLIDPHITSYVFLFVVIHPDKTQHARAPEAFDLLKKVPHALIRVIFKALIYRN